MFYNSQDTINALTNQNSELKSQMLQGFHDHSANPADLSSDEVRTFQSHKLQSCFKKSNRLSYILLKGY